MPERLETAFGFDGLGGDDQRTGIDQFGGIVDDVRTRLDVGEPVEHQALALQYTGALAARDHHDFVAGARKVRAEYGAERAGAENCESHSFPASYFFRYLSNQARMLSTLAMRFDGREVMPWDASGLRIMTESTLRSFNGLL